MSIMSNHFVQMFIQFNKVVAVLCLMCMSYIIFYTSKWRSWHGRLLEKWAQTYPTPDKISFQPAPLGLTCNPPLHELQSLHLFAEILKEFQHVHTFGLVFDWKLLTPRTLEDSDVVLELDVTTHPRLGRNVRHCVCHLLHRTRVLYRTRGPSILHPSV